MTNKTVLIIPVLTQDNSILALLKSINFSKWAKVLCLFDSCGWDYYSIVAELYPQMGGIRNTGKQLGFSRLTNIAIKITHKDLDSNILITTQYSKFPVEFSFIEQDGFIEFKPCSGIEPLANTFISKSVMDKIGYLDEAFVNSGSSEDYRMRAALAGFKTTFDNREDLEVSKPTLEITNFAQMQLCYKYGEKGLTVDKLFDKVINKFIFNEEMINV